MSVLIKGMEMPERCEKCFMCQSDCMGCKGTQNFIILKKGQNKPSWCPLVEVPPHGDLIDRETIVHVSGKWTTVENLLNFYTNEGCPATIIEAEGEENG